MPCDSIQLNSLDVGKMHPAILKAALINLGARNIVQGTATTSFYLDGQQITIRGGVLRVQEGYEGIADKVKVGYSRQVVATAAKQHGWKVREVKPNVFQVVK